ncbi:exported hypothetical protein [Gammaproteobacteria bacterium]
MKQRLTIAVLLLFALANGVQARPPRPILDELASPLSESELSGMGCLVGTAAIGGTLVYLLGGFGAIAGHLSGPLPASRVLEGAAAGAFIFSSACYVGAAMAPVVAMAYDTLTTPPMDDRPESGGTP